MRENQETVCEKFGQISPFFFGDSMKYCGLKAMRAFAFGVVMSGLAVACNEATQVAKTVAPEAEAVNVSAGKGLQSAQLTAEEREAKKREFFAKPEVKEMSAGLEEIAEAVAVAVEDKELRERIYAKCMEKFDGETNVLWQQLDGDDNLRSKGGWSKRIDDFVSKGRKNTVVKGVGNVDVAIKKFEKVFGAPLHLFWAFPENWDMKTAPLVAFVPMDMDPESRVSITGFDSKGNRIEFDKSGTLAKKRAVVVITFNERTSSDGRLKYGIKTSASFQGTRQIPGQQELRMQTGVSGGCTTIILNTVQVPSDVSLGGEFWWEGSSEWIYTFQVGGRNSLGWEQWWPWTTTTLGTGQFWAGVIFSPNRIHNLVPRDAVDEDFITNVEFKFYEDDGVSGQYDIFDDWYGFHSWSATSSNGPGSPIYTLPPPGSTVTKYDPNPQVTTVGTILGNYDSTNRYWMLCTCNVYLV